jgi:hypothetical protein
MVVIAGTTSPTIHYPRIWEQMAESFIHKNLADKRKEIQAYIGSLERDLEKARRDLSAIIVTEHQRLVRLIHKAGNLHEWATR